MPVTPLALWTLTPNWQYPVVERLSWLSSVLVSQSAAEQRFALRWSPRRSFEAFFSVDGRKRTLLDVGLSAAGAAEWYVPLWHDGDLSGVSISNGATSLAVNTTNREFRVGSFVMLWIDEFNAEVHEVTSIGSGTIGIDPATSRQWPAETRVFPCAKARIGDYPEFARKTGTVAEGAIRFDLSLDNEWTDPVASVGLPTYDSFPVLTHRPNRREDLTQRYERLLEDLDESVGLRMRRDVSGLSLPVYSHSWLRVGRAEQANLRALFYALKGRVSPIWIPTFQDDLILAEAADAADTSLLVQTCGLVRFGLPLVGRDHIRIRLRDGTDIYRQIVGVGASSGRELVTLDAALGVDFAPLDVAEISFMSLCRLNSDDVEINHVSADGGAAEINAAFRHAPNLRTATDIGLPFIGNTEMNDTPCGVSECVPTETLIAMGNGTNTQSLVTPVNDSGQIWFDGNGTTDSMFGLGEANTYNTTVFGFTQSVTASNDGDFSLTYTRSVTTTGGMIIQHFMPPVRQTFTACGPNQFETLLCDVTLDITGSTPFRLPIRFSLTTTDGDPQDVPVGDLSTWGFHQDTRSPTYVFEFDGTTLALYESSGLGEPVGLPLDYGPVFSIVGSSYEGSAVSAVGNVEMALYPQASGSLSVTINVTNFRRRCNC